MQGKDGSEMKSISTSACKDYDCASKISLLSNDKGHPLFLSLVYYMTLFKTLKLVMWEKHFWRTNSKTLLQPTSY